MTMLGERYAGGLLLAGTAVFTLAYAAGSAAGSTGAGMVMNLFGLIAGNLRPSAGAITFEDRRIDGLRPDQISRLGIARALEKQNGELRQPLKDAGHLSRDPRKKERKKPGQPGARKKFQFSKR